MQSFAVELRNELPESVRNDPATVEELELLSRRESRRNLLPFCAHVTPSYSFAAHIRHLAPYYEAIEAGEIDRLMVLLPPRHGKTWTGLHFLAWYLGRNPRDEIVLASYNDTIASHFSGRVRSILEQPQYQALCEEGGFGTAVDPGFRGKELWQTVHGGVFRAAGMKGGTSGFGGCGIYIDDFVKGRKDADSETIRRDIAETYSAELYPRLMPRYNGKSPWVAMAYTPWHEADLGMSELDAMERGFGDEWTVVRLPAVAEGDDPLGRIPGDALWPERYDTESLGRIKAVLDRINPRDFPALYQCRPSALEGTFYKLAMMPDLDRERVGRESHFVVTDWGAEGDETAHGVVAVDSRNDVSVVDAWHKQADTGVGTDALLDLIAKWRGVGSGVRGWIHAKGPLDKGTTPLVKLRARQRNIPLPPETTYNEGGSKEALSGTIQGYMAAGRVRFDHAADWWPWMRDQCLAFPAGSHDEAPDLLKLFGMHMAEQLCPADTPLTPVMAAGWEPRW